MPRRMASDSFRAEQEKYRYAPHVKPINDLVDSLRGGQRGWMPHVAPLHGGVDSAMLSILRDPGAATQDDAGSGFLCIENDDPTAERQVELFADVGLSAADFVPWNAYPWYINRKPTAAELEAGVDPLVRLIRLLPELRVVLLQGGEAKDGWRRYGKRFPTTAAKFHVIATYHPGRQALWHPDGAVRAARAEDRVAAYREAARILKG